MSWGETFYLPAPSPYPRSPGSVLMKQPSFARACLWPVGDYETSDWLLPPGRPTCPESASLRASTLPLLSRQRRPGQRLRPAGERGRGRREPPGRPSGARSWFRRRPEHGEHQTSSRKSDPVTAPVRAPCICRPSVSSASLMAAWGEARRGVCSHPSFHSASREQGRAAPLTGKGGH